MTVPASVYRPVSVEPTHSWVITLQKPLRTGFATFTVDGTYTAKPGSTRQQAYKDIRAWVEQQKPELVDANVMFFSLESNQL
ncbi:hypothetical protein ACFWXO_43000 [Kitasatospora sp. NPDC059088]|uniref:hypothetical protein n=1 Tax=Kitasatospora sp. NPDC059088 TaxID=3346722 RepID=UPI0036C888ED